MTSAEVPIRAGNLCEASRSVQCDARTLTPRLGQAPSAFLEDVAPLEHPVASAPCSAPHVPSEDVVSAPLARGGLVYIHAAEYRLGTRDQPSRGLLLSFPRPSVDPRLR